MKIKKNIKRMMASMYYMLQKSAILNGAEDNGFRILLYHSVNKADSADRLGIRVSPEHFFQQMQYLKQQGYKVGDLSSLIASLAQNQPLEPKTVAITFDDGYKDVMQIALPILKQFNFTATVFIAPGYIDGTTKSASSYWESWPFLSWADLKALDASGMSIGAHSLSHKPLASLTQDEMRKETKIAKETIEQKIAKPIGLFSYPHGSVNDEIKQMVRESGYYAACASIAGRNDHDDDIFELKRTQIEAGDSLFEFEKKLKGSYDWVAYFKANRGKA